MSEAPKKRPKYEKKEEKRQERKAAKRKAAEGGNIEDKQVKRQDS